MNAEEIYNEYWKSGLHHVSEWSSEYFDEHLGILKETKSVLDYGCGLGYSYQRQLCTFVDSYTGADVSDFVLENLRKKNLKGLKIREDSTLDVPDETFDAAICSEVFEHLYDPLAAAKELFRVIRPGGIFVATVPHFGYLPWRLRALLRAQVWSEPETEDNPFKGVHIRYFSIRMFRRLLELSGFSEIQIVPFDRNSIYDLGFALGRPLSSLTNWCDTHLPSWTKLQYLEHLCPTLFAKRLRAIAMKK